jgi:hypothetical protein
MSTKKSEPEHQGPPPPLTIIVPFTIVGIIVALVFGRDPRLIQQLLTLQELSITILATAAFIIYYEFYNIMSSGKSLVGFKLRDK